MRDLSIIWRMMLLLAVCEAVQAAPAAEIQPWQKLYTGQEATGANVIALWQFQPGQEAKDASGHGHDLTLRGNSRFVAGGPLGGYLESFLGGTDNDTKMGAVVKNHPNLSPAGAFTLEAWFAAKPEMEQAANVFAIDKKYFNYSRDDPRANWDYCLCLARAGQKQRRMLAHLGYGKDSATYSSDAFEVNPGEWIHVAFTYDGAGTGRFFVNGKPAGKTVHEGRGSITPGNYDLVLGDRYGSTHSGFPGYLAQVRLSNGVHLLHGNPGGDPWGRAHCVRAHGEGRVALAHREQRHRQDAHQRPGAGRLRWKHATDRPAEPGPQPGAGGAHSRGYLPAS